LFVLDNTLPSETFLNPSFWLISPSSYMSQ
jgi:hypothetical protein